MYLLCAMDRLVIYHIPILELELKERCTFIHTRCLLSDIFNLRNKLARFAQNSAMILYQDSFHRDLIYIQDNIGKELIKQMVDLPLNSFKSEFGWATAKYVCDFYKKREY